MHAVRSLALPLASLALLGACALGEGPAIPRDEPAPAGAFDAALVRRGAALAALGDCRGCHTADDGHAFAGGRALDTPFGTIYTTNITPDPDTGIGRWSDAAFRRAMREGIDRGGRHLYPAFPYDRFTLASDEDVHAIYAYLMTRPAVQARPPANRLAFPFNVRAFIGVWKSLYFRPGAYRPDPAHDARWNRGAYLAEGLGHCGSCHTPRNALGAEIAERHFDGGEAEGWHAYAINERSSAPVAWTEDALTAYLRRGWHELHGVSRGPMVSVTEALADVPEADVRALASYLLSSLPKRPSAAAMLEPDARAMDAEGQRIYDATCHGCHDGSQALPFGGIRLAWSTGVAGESARNLVNVVLYGLPAAEGRAAPVMPGYAGALDDRQVAALARYLRARFTTRPVWEDLDRVVREARAAGAAVRSPPVGGTGDDPAAIAQRRP